MKYFALLLILSWLGYTRASPCLPESEEEKYCKANVQFDVLVKVKNLMNNGNDGDINEGYKKYKVDILQDYRSNVVGEKSVDKMFVYTPPNDGLCGVDLKENTVYLLTGSFIDIGNKKRMKIELCGLNKEIAPPTCRTP